MVVRHAYGDAPDSTPTRTEIGARLTEMELLVAQNECFGKSRRWELAVWRPLVCGEFEVFIPKLSQLLWECTGPIEGKQRGAPLLPSEFIP